MMGSDLIVVFGYDIRFVSVLLAGRIPCGSGHT